MARIHIHARILLCERVGNLTMWDEHIIRVYITDLITQERVFVDVRLPSLENDVLEELAAFLFTPTERSKEELY